SGSTQRLRTLLRNVYWGRAKTLTELNRFGEAIEDWDRALTFDDGSGRDALRLLRAISIAHLGDHERARAEAQAVVDNPKTSAEAFYQAACIYSLSAAAAREDKKLSPEESQKQAEQYATRAVELLAKAEAAGLFNSPDVIRRMKTDSNLFPIVARDDFKRWLAALEAKSKPPGN